MKDFLRWIWACLFGPEIEPVTDMQLALMESKRAALDQEEWSRKHQEAVAFVLALQKMSDADYLKALDNPPEDYCQNPWWTGWIDKETDRRLKLARLRELTRLATQC